MSNFNPITTLLCTLLATASYANGCDSLANSNWSGKVKLTSGVVMPVQAHISHVALAGDGMYQLSGTINNEKLTGMFGCVEQRPGEIRSIMLDSQTVQLASHRISPDHQNPTQLVAISGQVNGYSVDTSTDPTNNYLSRT